MVVTGDFLPCDDAKTSRVCWEQSCSMICVPRYCLLTCNADIDLVRRWAEPGTDPAKYMYKVVNKGYVVNHTASPLQPLQLLKAPDKQPFEDTPCQP